jgi:hypothetical protein
MKTLIGLMGLLVLILGACQSKSDKGRMETASAWTRGTQCTSKVCDKELNAYLEGVAKKINGELAENKCSSDDQCQLVTGYGFCGSQLSVSKEVDRDAVTKFVNDYNEAQDDLSVKPACVPPKDSRAQCVDNKCGTTVIAE